VSRVKESPVERLTTPDGSVARESFLLKSKQMKLTGECNLCGACCFSASGAVCENLEILTRQGLPRATKCRVYAERYDGLPIRMIAKDGRILRGYYCAKNSPAEAKSIIEMGIKKGVCSLRRE
jgi:hypothetical protein